MIVLDTHVVIWSYLAPERIPHDAREAIMNADISGIATITLWEIGMMALKDRLDFELPVPLDEWMQRIVSQERITVLPITPRIACRASQLKMHGDPADRIIVSTALEYSCPAKEFAVSLTSGVKRA